jgi:hypothetical protein
MATENFVLRMVIASLLKLRLRRSSIDRRRAFRSLLDDQLRRATGAVSPWSAQKIKKSFAKLPASSAVFISTNCDWMP